MKQNNNLRTSDLHCPNNQVHTWCSLPAIES